MALICASAAAGVSAPSATISTAIVSAAQSVRLARRVFSRKSTPDQTVITKSCASPNNVSSTRQISAKRIQTAGSTRRNRS
jgi:hypothetical protein